MPSRARSRRQRRSEEGHHRPDNSDEFTSDITRTALGRRSNEHLSRQPAATKALLALSTSLQQMQSLQSVQPARPAQNARPRRCTAQPSQPASAQRRGVACAAGAVLDVTEATFEAEVLQARPTPRSAGPAAPQPPFSLAVGPVLHVAPVAPAVASSLLNTALRSRPCRCWWTSGPPGARRGAGSARAARAESCGLRSPPALAAGSRPLGAGVGRASLSPWWWRRWPRHAPCPASQAVYGLTDCVTRRRMRASG